MGPHRAAVMDPHHRAHLLLGRGLPYLRKGTGYDLPDILVNGSGKMCFSLPLPFSSLPEQSALKSLVELSTVGGQPHMLGCWGLVKGRRASLWDKSDSEQRVEDVHAPETLRRERRVNT